jgi:ABC-2 type transport system ATP-binding protein
MTSEPPGPASALLLRELTVERGGRAVVRDVSVEIPAGQVTALLGPNGAGKSSFVNLTLWRGRPDQGTLATLGCRPGSAAARGGTGVMLQSAALIEQLSVREHVSLFAGYYPHPLAPADVLERCGLTRLAERRYSALSGGQQRLVQFALAVCGRPQLLVLDEPTVALDAESRRRCWTVIRECAQAGAAVLLTTHQLEEAEALADRVVLLRAGQIIADGTPAEIRAHVAERTVRCRTSLARGVLERLPGVVSIDLEGGRLEARTTDAERTLRALLASDAGLSEIEVVRASLEEAFDRIINQEAA